MLGQCYHHSVFSFNSTILTKTKDAHFGTIIHLKHLSRISYILMGSIGKQVAGISDEGDGLILCQ